MPRVLFLLPMLAVLGLTACGDDEVALSACVSPNPLVPDVDLAVDGAGFFVTSTGAELRYSPTGDFCVDQAGVLVNALGQAVQGHAALPGGTFNTGQLSDVQLPLAAMSGGTLTDVTVGAAGVIEAVYTAGGNLVVGQLALADFPSSQNLEAERDAVCRETPASGPARRGVAGQAGFGTIEQGALDAFACEQGRFDVRVDGEGYFVLDNAGVTHYAASMILGTDNLSRYVDEHGYRVAGYAVDASGALVAALVGLAAPGGAMPPAATSNVELNGNLDSAASSPPVAPFDPNDPLSYNFATAVTILDSLGVAHGLTVHFAKRAPAGTWDLHVSVDGVQGACPFQALTFSGGVLTSPGAIACGPVLLSNGAADLEFSLGVAAITQTGADFSVGAAFQDGYPEGQVTAAHVSAAGEIRLDYSNGRTGVLQGQLLLARFPVAGALALSADGETYLGTAGAGAPVIDVPGSPEPGEVTATPR